MKITLIYPGFANLGFDSLGKGGMDNNWINLGLAYIGAYLKKHGYKVRLIDLRDLKNWEQLESELAADDATIIGVHFNAPNYDFAIKCCVIAKKMGKTVVAGGPHATIAPQLLIDSGSVDYVVVGEGEISFLKLVRKIEKGDYINEKIILGERVEHLDALPFPDRDLYDMAKIMNTKGNFPYLDNGAILMASRGCPYQCSFCQPLVDKMFGRKIRYRSVENVIWEMKEVISRYGAKYLSFQDDTFTADKAWVLEFCQKIRDENIKVQWSAQSRVNTFDDELARAMNAAGCICIFFGFESGSQRILDLYKKGITPEQSRKAAQICKKHGIIIFADYIFGAPTETEDEMQMTIDLIKDIYPEMHSPTYFTPVPGCELYDYCRSNDLINIKDSSGYDRSPLGEKIKGVDYKMIEKYKKLAEKSSPVWYQEKHYAALALKRWANLIRRGDILNFLREFVGRSLSPGSAPYNLLRSVSKRAGAK